MPDSHATWKTYNVQDIHKCCTRMGCHQRKLLVCNWRIRNKAGDSTEYYFSDFDGGFLTVLFMQQWDDIEWACVPRNNFQRPSDIWLKAFAGENYPDIDKVSRESFSDRSPNKILVSTLQMRNPLEAIQLLEDL